MVEALCAAAPEVVEWIADTGYPIEIGADMPRPGCQSRACTPTSGGSAAVAFVRHLRGLLDERPNVAFVDEAPAVGLLTSPSGVEGLVISQNGNREEVAARATVLATDGFAANPALMDEHLAHLGRPFHGGTSTNTGDARTLAGRARRPVPEHGGRPPLRPGRGRPRHAGLPALQFTGAVLLDTSGSRFVDEEAHGYSSMAGILQQQPGERAAMVWDATAMAATRESEMMRESLAAGAIATLPTLAALADQLGITVATAEEALAPRQVADGCGRRTTWPG